MGRASFRVAVVGAGLTGIASAIGLSRAGHSVTVFEKSSELAQIGAGINIGPNAIRIFREWGLYEQLEEYTIKYELAKVLSYRDGSELTVIKTDLDANPPTADMVIYRVDLLRVLVSEAERRGVVVQLGAEITDVQSVPPSGPTITLSTGSVSHWDAILVADGERSSVRKMVNGQEVMMHDSGDHVFRMTLEMSEVLQREGLKHLVSPPNKAIWMGPGGNAHMYPVKRGEMLNVVLTREHSRAAIPPMKPESVSTEQVLSEFQGWDPELTKLLAQGGPYMKWTLLESDTVNDWTNPTSDITLVGDAAHAMLPYLGQGAAMGFEDAAVLETLFSLANDKAEIPEVLAIYETLRTPRTMTVREQSKKMHEIYNMADGEQQQTRDQQIKSGIPAEGNPIFYQDPVFSKWLFDYDPFDEAKNAWAQHKDSSSSSQETGWTGTVSMNHRFAQDYRQLC